MRIIPPSLLLESAQTVGEKDRKRQTGCVGVELNCVAPTHSAVCPYGAVKFALFFSTKIQHRGTDATVPFCSC